MADAPRGIERFREPSRYIASADAKAAVQVALMLRQPLVLTGEPGTGKSQLASWVAHQLEWTLIKFVAKSTTTATDLLYRFDAVREFRESQRDDPLPEDATRYLTFQGLGRAIALTYPMDAAVMKETWNEEANKLPGDEISRIAQAANSVVLIDEIDKAPRDVPNDLLTEFESGEFVIPELKARLKVQGDRRPLVICTSNSEKSLPDAFLRRCIFHHIAMPTDAQLSEIIAAQTGDMDIGPRMIEDIRELFQKLQGPSPAIMLRKRPSIPEALGVLLAFGDRSKLPGAGLLASSADRVVPTFRGQGMKGGLKALAAAKTDSDQAAARIAFGQFISIMFKDKDDQEAARDWICESWKLPDSLRAAGTPERA